jgi:hypothetical protein
MARVGQYLTDLPEERLAKYLEMAQHAHELAKTATAPEARNTYIAMARVWETLVEETKRILEAEVPNTEVPNLDATLPPTKPFDPDR